MNLEFSGGIWYWKGPPPFFFVTLPGEESDLLLAVSASVSYGWGMIQVTAQVGRTEWTTALFPKDGRYVMPLKAEVRTAEGLKEGGTVEVRLVIPL